MDLEDQQPLSLISQPEAASPSDALDLLDSFASRAIPTAGPEAPEPEHGRDVMFQRPAAMRLAESVVYRPGVVVAVALLVGPALCGIGAAAAIDVSGSIPVWLPLVLLLWLPALVLVWGMLKSVRVTSEAVACGRPLGQWRSIAFDEIELVEQRGLRLVVSGRNRSPLVFTPLLLHRGAQLRRTLLLRLPLPALAGDLRRQAQRLSVGDVLGAGIGDISGVLTVRTRLRWPALAGGGAVALLTLAVLAAFMLPAPLDALVTFALALLAGTVGFASLWSVQEVFVSEKGLNIRYILLRRERDVLWAQVKQIAYTPREATLFFRGPRRLSISIGPGLLNQGQARLMRQFIGRYCSAEVVPSLTRTAH